MHGAIFPSSAPWGTNVTPQYDESLTDAQVVKFGTGPGSRYDQINRSNRKLFQDEWMRGGFADAHQHDAWALQTSGNAVGGGTIRRSTEATYNRRSPSTIGNTSMYQPDFELTAKDHQTYGAGSDYGFIG